MFIFKLGCPERKENNSLPSKCRFKIPEIDELRYVLKLKTRASSFMFPLFVADLDKTYRNETKIGKKILL